MTLKIWAKGDTVSHDDLNLNFSTLANTPLFALPISGGTMTGPLVLVADPTAALQPATKQYADAETAARIAETASRIAAARGQLGGLGLSNDIATPNTVLDIASGTATDSTNTTTITLGAFTKSIAGAWSAGTGNAGMGVGLTATLSTWYHVFAAIISGAADVFFDTSAVAANAPAGTTAFRRIGSFKLDASVHILPFAQNGDWFDWGTTSLEFTGTPGVTTAVTHTLIGCPPGVVTQVMLSGYMNDTTVPNASMYISSLAQADQAPSISANTAIASTTNVNCSFNVSVTTNTSQQVRFRAATTTLAAAVTSRGYIDRRGRG
jgi:hypothetical protein